jgi:hypothetical protein
MRNIYNRLESKMKNKLGYFGALGFVGILGIITDNRYLLAFFAYFVFLRYFFVIPDELFKLNVQKAATPAFFVGIALQVLTIAVTAFTKDITQLVTGLALGFSVSTAVFILILVISEFKEYRGR